MVSNEPLAQLPATVTDDFEARWAPWVARGRVREQRVRRKFVLSASALSVGAAAVALIYALLRQ
jgi:hypothetical protein